MRLCPGILKLAVLLVGLPIILWLATFSKTMSLYGEYRSLSKSEVADSVSSQRFTVSCENRLAGDCLVREILAGEDEVIINEYAPSVEKSDGGLSIVRARLQLRGALHSASQSCASFRESTRDLAGGHLFLSQDWKRFIGDLGLGFDSIGWR